MAEPYTQIYLHLVWATCHRRPMLSGEVREIAYRAIRAECKRLATPVISLGGMEDHVHLLVRLPTTLAIATLLQQVKGGSSHLLANAAGIESFQWQGGYGAFTVTRSLVPQVKAYIENQEEHHARTTIIPALEHLVKHST